MVCIHAGPPVFALCRHGKEYHRGTTIYGDVDILPPNTPASWELKSTDVDLVIAIKRELLERVVTDSGRNPCHLEIRSRFHASDTQIEHIGWALKAELENGYPCGQIYMDSLAGRWPHASSEGTVHSRLCLTGQEAKCLTAD